jgi:hypothetical protein
MMAKTGFNRVRALLATTLLMVGLLAVDNVSKLQNT